jgi:hypothetical protein
MRKGWVVFALVSLCFSGCSDTVTSRLSPGSAVVIYMPDATETPKAVPGGPPPLPNDRVLVEELSREGEALPSVSVGTKATVAADDRQPGDGSRKVRVNFQDGEYKGLTGLIARENLRLVK